MRRLEPVAPLAPELALEPQPTCGTEPPALSTPTLVRPSPGADEDPDDFAGPLAAW